MLTLSNIHEATERRQWQALIDDALADWDRDPIQLADDGIPAPSRDTIRWAMRLAKQLREQGVMPPTRIVTDAHASIVFEREAGRLFESYRIAADGNVEFCEFEDCRLVKRTPLSLVDY